MRALLLLPLTIAGCFGASARPRGTPAEPTRGAYAELEDLDRACETSQRQDACDALARRLQDGVAGGDREAGVLVQRIGERWRTRCDNGNAEACVSLARAAKRKLATTPKDDPSSGPLIEEFDALLDKGCAAGSGASCAELSAMYLRGEFVPPDPARARAAAERGCTSKLAEGCTGLGWIYADGTGVPTDTERARTLFERGCDGGDGGGCMALGLMIARGNVSPADVARMVELFDKACSLKYAPACASLAKAYLTGDGVARDEARGRRLQEKACEAGDLPACAEVRARGGVPGPRVPTSL